MQYAEILLTFTDGYVCLCGVCSLWTVCEGVIVPYVVSAVTVMDVLVFVQHDFPGIKPAWSLIRC